jgi:hypothetical protein
MNISCIYNNQATNLVSISVDGTEIYVTEVTSANNLQVSKKFLTPGQSSVVIATSATIN